MSEWRYLAYRLNGDGTDTFLAEVPLADAQITDALSTPTGLTGKVPADFAAQVADDGWPILHEWGTAIFAEKDDEIRGGGILSNKPDLHTSQPDVDCVGYSGYLKRQPWLGDPYYRVDIETLDVVRDIWSWAQSQPGGNIGLQLSDLVTGVRIGTELQLVEFTTGLGETVEFEAGPVKLVHWITDDLAGKIDELARECPFEYRERHAYNEAGELEHHLDFGYPQIGARRHDLTFRLGVNIATPPPLTSLGEDYANMVQALGAGEGKDRLRAVLGGVPTDGRLRRVVNVEDKDLRTLGGVRNLAARELSWRTGLLDLSEVAVLDHVHAPLGSFSVGDEIFVEADYDGFDLSAWFRIVSTAIRPDSPEVMGLSVIRTDRLEVA